MKSLPLTRAAWDATRARLSAAMGLPRVPTEADRIGGGVHVPLALCATTEPCESVALDDGSFEAVVPPELEVRLSAPERAQLRAVTVRRGVREQTEQFEEPDPTLREADLSLLRALGR